MNCLYAFKYVFLAKQAQSINTQLVCLDAQQYSLQTEKQLKSVRSYFKKISSVYPQVPGILRAQDIIVVYNTRTIDIPVEHLQQSKKTHS